MKNKYRKREFRHLRTRKHLKGTSVRPRLSVFRSAKHIYAQLIDDPVGKTLTVSSDLEFRKSKEKDSRLERASQVGASLAKKAIGLKIKNVVFDRGKYKYHGRVKALAEGARSGGLSF